MQTKKVSTVLVNSIGVIGYIAVMLAWLWLVIVSFSLFMNSDLFTQLASNVGTDQAASSPFSEFEVPDAASLILGSVVIVLIVIATIYIVIKLPVSTIKKSSQYTKKASNAIIPLVTANKKLSGKQKKTTSTRVIFYLKMTVSILPLLIIIILEALYTTNNLLPGVAFFITSLLTFLACFFFWLQLALAKVLRVDSSETV